MRGKWENTSSASPHILDQWTLAWERVNYVCMYVWMRMSELASKWVYCSMGSILYDKNQSLDGKSFSFFLFLTKNECLKKKNQMKPVAVAVYDNTDNIRNKSQPHRTIPIHLFWHI